MRRSFNFGPYKCNVFQLQTIERFVRGRDAAFCQITLTACYFFITAITIMLPSSVEFLLESLYPKD